LFQGAGDAQQGRAEFLFHALGRQFLGRAAAGKRQRRAGVAQDQGHGHAIDVRLPAAGRGAEATLADVAQGALDAAIEYAKGRKQFGRAIAEFQGLQFMLADMAIQVEAARALVYECARMADAGDFSRLSEMASMAKCFASDTAMKVTTDAVQVFGGAGYMKDYPVERMMRDAKINQIFEGTNQIQRIVISRHILGMH